MKEFVHLHLHSEYSLLDGACRISEIPKRAAELGQKAVAVTDHGVMYGAVAFYDACKAADVKPIIGCEVYVAKRSYLDKSGSGETEPNHLVLLVKNETGYKNLIDIVSRSFTEGFYRKPRVDKTLLEEHSEGLICLSGCLAGYIPRQIVKGNYPAAESYARELDRIFGRGNFYLEIQDHGIEEQKLVNECIAGISERTGIPMVATNDVHYLKREDASVQAVMMCIQTNTLISAGRPMGFEKDEFYMKSGDEMEKLFRKYDEALENTVKISEMCNYEFTFGKTFLLRFDPPDGKTAKAYLRELVFKGLERREKNRDIIYSEKNKREDYKMRIEYEYLVVCSMGYAEYYLIVADFVGYAKSHGITTGPGRGSGAGSLIAYLIGITEIDPVKYELLFESFLNKQRVSMPDFDIDFCDRRRDEVIKYVSDKYGSDHVAQIVTFGTMAAKAALRDVGRVTGMSYRETDDVVRAFSEANDSSDLTSALRDPKFRALYDSDNKARELIDIAMSIEGMPRNASTHAAGVVITDRPISDYVPLSVNGEVTVTQYDMDTVARLGLLKFDFLAIRYLTVISDAEAEIKKTEPSFNIDHIPLDDSDTYAMLSDGKTDGIFQLESAGMTRLLTEMKPGNISDIMIALALYRPGPMEFINRYLENRAAPLKIKYKIDCLKDILDETSGCILYQEQIMQIFRSVAGYTYGRADIVRRAISKKKAGVIEQERDNFLAGAADKGYDRSAAEELYSELPAFANYGFKKSHAAAYAVVSYRTAYLKCHYAPVYYASLISSVFGNGAKVSEYVNQAAKLGIKTLPPDINKSGNGFTVDGKNIRYGLSAISKVGTMFIDRVIGERRKRPFTSFYDFAVRASSFTELNRQQAESLIKAGTFDSLGEYRSRLLAGCGEVIESLHAGGRSGINGQVDFFSSDSFTFSYPELPEISTREKLAMEKEVTGMYLSGNILDEYTENINFLHPETLVSVLSSLKEDTSNCGVKKQITVCGTVTKVVPKVTKNGDPMAFMSIDDGTEEVSAVLFPKVFSKFTEGISADDVVWVRADTDIRNGDISLIVTDGGLMLPNGEFTAPNRVLTAPKNETKSNNSSEPEIPENKSVKLYVRVKNRTCREFMRTVALLRIFDGENEAIIYDESEKKYYRSGLRVQASGFLSKELGEIVGNENVIVK